MNQTLSRTTNAIQRLPLYISESIGSRNESLLYLIKSNRDTLVQSRFALGLPVDFAAFILAYCRCENCGARIRKYFNRCSCGGGQDEYADLKVSYPTVLHRAIFLKLVERERARTAGTKRRQTMQKNGGSFSKKLVPAMYQAQHGRCYFCGTSISIGNKSLHIDHYQAVADGGTNGIENLVLTCVQCNLDKNSMHGDLFDIHARKLRSPEFSKEIRRIRKNLRVLRKNIQSIGG